MSALTTTNFLVTLLLLTLLITLTLTNLTITRLSRILTLPKPRSRPRAQTTSLSTSASTSDTPQQYEPGRKPNQKAHLLILLGSGGHTTEMLSILRTLGPSYLDTRFARRTWVVSSGDGFSAARAGDFEEELKGLRDGIGDVTGGDSAKWDIVTVKRARRVHQSLLTTPISAVGCLVDCLGVLRGSHQEKKEQEQHSGGAGKESGFDYNYNHDHNYPDLILTNGPGTGVIMVLASLLLLFVGLAPIRVKKVQTSTSTSTSPPASSNTSTSTNTARETNAEELETEEIGSMRSIYIESWARVKTLSLSGRILRFLAGRVLVQWRGLGDLDRTVLQTGEVGKMGRGDEGVTVGGSDEGDRSGSTSMRIQRKEGDSSRNDGDRYAGSIWPRRTEYIGAVVT